MTEIVVEGVLFVVLVATAVALLILALMQFTPLGLRIRQARNRRLIEAAANRDCPIHGARICPECFKEAVNG